jgi:ferrous iron transport protein B
VERTIALVGNPNSGKTTLFNALTGSNQYVGNWPGVTVEHKEGKLRTDKSVTITDLPGIYSLSPYSPEEVIARDYVLNEKPDVIINIVDGTNLERNLYLTTQVLELGVPVVLAVNMMDAVRKAGDAIDSDALAKILGCSVVEISALKNEGIDKLIETATRDDLKASTAFTTFAPQVESALSKIQELALQDIPQEQKRWYAVKLFEGDEKVYEKLGLRVIDEEEPQTADVELSPEKEELSQQIAQITQACENHFDDDPESIITAGRYTQIDSVITRSCRRASKGKLSTSDKIDRIVTNRWLGLPIFVLVMFLVYFISVSTVGTWATDWANDGLFGDGWFIVGDQEAYDEAAGDFELASGEIEAYNTAAEEAGLDPESSDFLAEAGQANIIADYSNYDDETGENEIIEVDAVTYAEALEVEEPDPQNYGIWVPGLPVLIENGLTAIDCDPLVQSLILDGIVAGVGAVLGFVPQLLVLFLLLALLESCGYLSRVAFVLDRVFRRFGLSGKSFIPILIGTGCGVPGIMASRTIENESDRRMTVMTTTFIPCSAKLPIIALIAGAIFGGAWWVAPSAYFLGIASILCSGIILKKTKIFASANTPFVMELPAYHIPTAGVVLRSMWERAWSFIKKAGTVILLATILVWFISGFGFVDGNFGLVEDQNDSLLAIIAGSIAWIFAPLGWANWQAVGATITGLIAKENVVGTFAILYAGDVSWYTSLQAAFTPVAGYSLLAFNLLCAPCFAAMGAIKREMNSRVWFWRAIGYQCGFAYCVSLVIYQLVGLLTHDVSVNVFTFVAVGLVLLFFYLLIRPNKNYGYKKNQALDAELG